MADEKTELGRIVGFRPNGQAIVEWPDGSRSFVWLLISRGDDGRTWTLDPPVRRIV